MPLILVATPIGNLNDLSPRAAAALADADLIAAEDTRVTAKLLAHIGAKRPMLSYHAHNRREREEELLARLTAGERVVLVSDAGLPAVSDPGQELVAACHASGIPVGVIPGPSAGVAALAASGLGSGRFCFEGFLSVNRRARQEHLAALAEEQRVMIFYEAPHKLALTLRDLAAAFGDTRRVTLARELTKLHEELRVATLGEAAAYYTDNAPRGEFVLVVEGAPPPAAPPAGALEEAVALARALLAEGASPTDAARQAASATGRRKAEVYKAMTREE